jgi:hypothetical protein
MSSLITIFKSKQLFFSLQDFNRLLLSIDIEYHSFNSDFLCCEPWSSGLYGLKNALPYPKYTKTGVAIPPAVSVDNKTMRQAGMSELAWRTEVTARF